MEGGLYRLLLSNIVGVPTGLPSVLQVLVETCFIMCSGGSLWNRAFVKGTCSHPYYSISFSRRLQTWPTRVSRQKHAIDALVHLGKKWGRG